MKKELNFNLAKAFIKPYKANDDIRVELYIVNKKGEKLVLNDSNDKNFNFNLTNYIDKDLEVRINGKNIVDCKNNILKTYENIFNSGKIAKLVKTNNGGAVGIGNEVLCRLNIDELPTNIFKNRNSFNVKIISDNEWEIERYCNIHAHTEYSVLDGLTDINDYAEKVVYSAAITDHGNMYGHLMFKHAMDKLNKKAIIGEEFYVQTPKGQRIQAKQNLDTTDIEDAMFDKPKRQNDEGFSGEHLLVLAKNDIGFKNLKWLSSNAFEQIHKKPHITYEQLFEHKEGLIATSACLAGSLAQSVKEYLKAATLDPVKAWVKEDEKFFKSEKYLKLIKAEYYSEDDLMNLKAYEYNYKLSRYFIKTMINEFGDDFYLEIQHHNIDIETKVMNEIIRIAKAEFPNVKLVIGIDSHYLNKEDAYTHEVWLCRQTQAKMTDEKRMKFNGDGYWVHSSDEVIDRFSIYEDYQDWMDNTLEIADKVKYNKAMKNDGYHLPHYPTPINPKTNEAYSEQEYFEILVKEGYKNRFKGTEKYNNKEYQERLKYEVKIIKQMGWPSYFLIVQDFIAWAKDDKISEHIERYFPSNHYNHKNLQPELIKNYSILVGPGRGSGVGSLVNYCLGITDLDPIEYNLLFERFLNPERVSMPDIDTDFESSGRQAVFEYVRQKYGRANVAQVITFGTSKAKDAVKSVARCLGYEVAVGEKISALIPDTPGVKMKDVFNKENENFVTLIKQDPRVKDIVKIAFKWENKVTNVGIHACACLITDKAIENYMPQVKLKNPKTNTYEWITSVEGPVCEELGCLKMDFLGIATYDYIHECLDMIEQNTGKKIEFKDIPLEEEETLKYLTKGHTDSVFQLESEGMRGLLAKMGPTKFEHIAAILALYRPGPMQFIDDYVNGFKKPETVEYPHPIFKEVTQDTFGVLVYQEQIMSLVQKMAGFTLGQADVLRRGIGKKIAKYLVEGRYKFIDGAEKLHHIDKKLSNEIYDTIVKFANYGFNKSHAVGYAALTARTGWLYCHYPYEFLTAVLNNSLGNNDNLTKYLNACRNNKFKVLAPSINESGARFTTDGSAIRVGLAGLKSVGKSSQAVIAEREARGNFKDFIDFIYRMSKYQNLDRTLLEVFIKVGIFDEYPGTRYDKVESIVDILDLKDSIKEMESGDNYSIFNLKNINSSDFVKFSFKNTGEEYSSLEKALYEKELSGMYITTYPLDEYKKDISGCKTIEEINSKDNGSNVKCAGVLIDVTERVAKKKNTKFYTAKFEDQTGTINLIYFPMSDELGKAYTTVLLNAMHIITPAVIEGKIKEDSFGRSIMISSVESLRKLNNLIQEKFRIDVNDEEEYQKLVDILSSLGKGGNTVTVNDRVFKNIRINDDTYRELKKYHIKRD